MVLTTPRVVGSTPVPPLELPLRVLAELPVQLPGPHPLHTAHKLLWVIPKKWCCDCSLSHHITSNAKSIHLLLLPFFPPANSAAVLWRKVTFLHNSLKICVQVSQSCWNTAFFPPTKDFSHFGISHTLTTIISTCFTTPFECYPPASQEKKYCLYLQNRKAETERGYSSLLLSQLRWQDHTEHPDTDRVLQREICSTSLTHIPWTNPLGASFFSLHSSSLGITITYTCT